MSRHRVVLREAAERDIEEIVERLRAEGATDAASTFVDELERALRRLAQLPRSGSLRFAHDLGLPDLRALALRRHPYLVFYRAPTSDAPFVDVWRVLHSRRDVPSALAPR